MLRYLQLCILLILNQDVYSEADEEASAGEHRAEQVSQNDSVMVLVVVGLLVLTVLTIWLFKVKRFRFVHETGLCMFYGMIAGIIIKYSGSGMYRRGTNVDVNLTTAPVSLWVNFPSGVKYSYDRKGVVHPHQHKGRGMLESKAVFDPEIFFYALLPPIIFFAGYDMKKRFFFRNLGAIMTFAFIGTIISFIVFGGLLYGFIKMFAASSYPGFGFLECLLFGSLISATDPVTILAIFHDLNVEVDLYAIVFGESVMNDAVAIVLYRSILSYQGIEFNTIGFFEALGQFIGVFAGSFVLGSAMGLGTALLTKLTKIGQFPVLETALFTLMSYSTFLIAESLHLTGIVTVLFCGIAQAHYTYNNLSPQSQQATKSIFGLLNFLAENFIFSYMGLTVFTFEDHQWDVGFIIWTILACGVSRALNIYPLSFILNLKRTKKIKHNAQHMLWFGGLRGAVAFALAIRNTEGQPRQLMLTSVLMVSVVTVMFNGSLTTQALNKLGIKINVDPNEEITRTISTTAQGKSNKFSITEDEHGGIHEDISYERSWMVRKWHQFDVKYMKPLFTTRGGTFEAELPLGCGVISSCCGIQPTQTNTSEEYQPRAESRQMEGMEDVPSIDDEMIDVSLVQELINNSAVVNNAGSTYVDFSTLRGDGPVSL